MSELRPPRFEGAFHLRDGRDLGYAEYGPATGRPLVWFHGTPGARRQIAPRARQLADERNVRILAVERPGIGASTPHAYASVREWAEDIEQFCDAKEIDRFAVAGLSGGGPYALSCAHRMPTRVVAAAILGGVAPSVGEDAAEGGVSPLVRLAPDLLLRVRGPVGNTLRRLIRVLEPWSDEAVDAFARFMPEGDREVFRDPAMRQMFIEDLQRGARRQMQALVHDAALFGRHWGFPLAEIQVPVHLWYGDADNIVPVEHGEHLAERIPGAVFKRRPGEGHLGGLGAAEELIDAMLRHWEEYEE